jgi:hypothetical protein
MKIKLTLNCLVVLIWEDSNYRDGWTFDEPETEPFLCHTVGWLVAFTDSQLVIASTMSESGKQRCGDMTIPRSCVKSATILKWNPVKPQNK